MTGFDLFFSGLLFALGFWVGWLVVSEYRRGRDIPPFIQAVTFLGGALLIWVSYSLLTN